MSAAFELVVFDWDGTLMDSQARIVGGMRSAIAELALPTRTDGQISNIIGLGMDEAILSLFPDSTDEGLVRFRDCYREHFLGDAVPDSILFSGVTEMLDILVASGYRLAVATGKSRRGLDRELSESGVADRFETTRCADESPSKPHPGMLEEIMDELLASPKRTLVVGDSVYDLEMAANAGAASVGVTYGVHDKSRLLECGPLAFFDDLSDLPDWLGQSNRQGTINE